MVAREDDLKRGRELFAEQRWMSAHDALAAVDRVEPLAADDLEHLATCAYMVGREGEYMELLERAYRAHLDGGEQRVALRCAFWIGVHLASRGEIGRANGWLSRARRLLDEQEGDCVERGYLLLPLVFEQEATGDLDAAAATAGEAAKVARRFADEDLFALAVHEHGHILIRRGSLTEGLRLLDEAMVGVTAGELSPIVAGIVYCGVILACRDAHEIARAREWTTALSDWCEAQPDLVAFTGRCLVHRAELMHLRGDWSEALDEARRAALRCEEGENPGAAGEAWYRQGEIRRTRGERASAEAAYREASRRGREPQPGLALLRLSQGDLDAASAAIRRALAEVDEPGRRADLLVACVEIGIAAEDVEAAADAATELESLVQGHDHGALGAMAAGARGTVELARRNPEGALPALRRAEAVWVQLDAPYEAARVRERIGLACEALGDEDTAALDLEASRNAYEALRAKPDLDRLALSKATGADAHGMTERELEVLRHVAAGETNKAIAERLVLSQRTIDRHVSNIFAKLGVSSRAAATAYAYRNRLL